VRAPAGSLHRLRRAPRTSSASLALAFVLLGSLLAAACTSSASDSATTTTASSSTAPAPGGTDPRPAALRWTACDHGLECARLRVPVDYDRPAGAHLTLSVIRRPALDQAHKVGELVVNPGGPGASGVTMVTDGFGGANHFDERFDIVSWDTRGSGASDPLRCSEGVTAFQALDPDPTTVAAQTRLDAHAQTIARDCGRNGGDLIDHMDTATTARDLEQLRLALGGAKLNYAGYSYGTAIGLAYAARYPTHVRSMVLDGVIEPNWNLSQLLTVQAAALEQRLQAMFDQCEASTSCPVREPAAAYDALVAQLRAHPEAAGPGRAIGPGELATASVFSTYDPSYVTPFFAALAAARAGDGRGVLALADDYRGEVTSYAAYVGVVCTDLPHPVGAEAYQTFATSLAHRFPRVGAAVANEVLPCAFWPVPVARSPEIVTAAGAPTILVVGNTGDAATPLAASVSVARHLARSRLLTFDGQGHTSVDRSSCVDNAERSYLEALAVPPPGALCVAS
jgi:pimeloyl-ACP methyl ester carboxylesterase